MAVMPNMLKILLSPRGRMGRRDYIIGLVGIVILSTVFNFVLGRLGNSVWAFLISLPFPFLVLHMTYCVYGKRLHDIGRSFWPVTGLIVALIAIMIAVMMTFGGSEYFTAFSEYTSDNPAPEDVQATLQAEYQARLAEGTGWLYGSMCGLIGAFSLWLALAKPDAKENQYGAP